MVTHNQGTPHLDGEPIRIRRTIGHGNEFRALHLE